MKKLILASLITVASMGTVVAQDHVPLTGKQLVSSPAYKSHAYINGVIDSKVHIVPCKRNDSWSPDQRADLVIKEISIHDDLWNKSAERATWLAYGDACNGDTTKDEMTFRHRFEKSVTPSH